MEARAKLRSFKRRRVTQTKKLCPKVERNASLRKVSGILRKSEGARSAEERAVLASMTEEVREAKRRLSRRQRAIERSQELEDDAATLRSKCDKLAEAITNARHLIVYTGAGISTAADIPDYRGPHGVWTMLQQGKQLAKVDISRAQPTYTHMALRELHSRGALKFVVSQNCDGLHLRSGLPRRALAEVHGNMYIELCHECSPSTPYWRVFDTTERTARFYHQTTRICHYCGASLVDSIVHFGERGSAAWPLNWAGALRHADAADVVLCLGSSLKVLRRYPWLWNMQKPVEKRPSLFIVNLQWTPKDHAATLKVNGKCDKVMSYIMRRLGIKVRPYEKQLDPIFAHATPLSPRELHTTRRPMLKMSENNVQISQFYDESEDSDDNLPLSELKVDKHFDYSVNSLKVNDLDKSSRHDNKFKLKNEFGENFKISDDIKLLDPKQCNGLNVKDENDLPLSRLKLLKDINNKVNCDLKSLSKTSPVKFLFPNCSNNTVNDLINKKNVENIFNIKLSEIESNRNQMKQESIDNKINIVKVEVTERTDKETLDRKCTEQSNLVNKVSLKDEHDKSSLILKPQAKEEVRDHFKCRRVSNYELTNPLKSQDQSNGNVLSNETLNNTDSGIDNRDDEFDTLDELGNVKKENVFDDQNDQCSCLKEDSDEIVNDLEIQDGSCKCKDNREKSVKYDRDKEETHTFKIHMMTDAVTIMLLARHSFESNLDTGQYNGSNNSSESFKTYKKEINQTGMELPSNIYKHSKTKSSCDKDKDKTIDVNNHVQIDDNYHISVKETYNQINCNGKLGNFDIIKPLAVMKIVDDLIKGDFESEKKIKSEANKVTKTSNDAVLDEHYNSKIGLVSDNETSKLDPKQLQTKLIENPGSINQIHRLSVNLSEKDESISDDSITEPNKPAKQNYIFSNKLNETEINNGASYLKKEILDCISNQTGTTANRDSKNHFENELQQNSQKDKTFRITSENCNSEDNQNNQEDSNINANASELSQFGTIMGFKTQPNLSTRLPSALLRNLLNKPAAPFTNSKNHVDNKLIEPNNSVLQSETRVLSEVENDVEDLENVLEFSIVAKTSTEHSEVFYDKTSINSKDLNEKIENKLLVDLDIKNNFSLSKVPPNKPKLDSLRNFRKCKENEQNAFINSVHSRRNNNLLRDLRKQAVVRNDLQLRARLNESHDISKLQRINENLARFTNKNKWDDEAKLAAECGEFAKAIIRHTVLVCRTQTRLLYSGLHSIIGPGPFIERSRTPPVTRSQKHTRKRKRSPECKFCADNFKTSRCAFYVPHNSDDRIEKKVNGKLVMCGCCGETSSESDDENSENEEKTDSNVKEKLNKDQKDSKTEDKIVKKEEKEHRIKPKEEKWIQPVNKSYDCDDDLVQQPGWFGKGYRKGRKRR